MEPIKKSDITSSQNGVHNPADPKFKSFKDVMFDEINAQSQSNVSKPGEKSENNRFSDPMPVNSKRIKTSSRFEDATPKRSSNWDVTSKTNGQSTPLRSGTQTPLRDASTLTGWDRSARVEKFQSTPSAVRDLTTPATVRSYFGDDKGADKKSVHTSSETVDAQSETPKPSVKQEIDPRNKYLSDEELNSMLPAEGFEIVRPPENYRPVKLTRDFLTPQNRDFNQKKALLSQHGIAEQPNVKSLAIAERANDDLPAMREDDLKIFGVLLESEAHVTPYEQRQRKILTLLLKIKNGTPVIRKAAMRILTDRCRELGAELIFGQLFPLIASPTLDEWERHLMVKVLNRMMFRLEELCRPFTTSILQIVTPMLIDEDNYVRSEGRELVANLAKAVGLPSIITALRPDIDNKDDIIRNTTARAFAVVAGALGVPQFLPFLKAVCKSKKSWEARHTGCKIIQQIAILFGCGVLPFLQSFVEILKPLLSDEQMKIKVLACIAVTSLAEAASPFGMESFDVLLEDLWNGLNGHRGRPLASFLRAVGSLIPLMSEEYASEYIKYVMNVILREFESPEDETKRILLKVIKQCLDNKLIKPDFILEKILPNFWDNFWLRKLCSDRYVSDQLAETTLSLAKKIGGMKVLPQLVLYLKEDHEHLRKTALETIVQIMKNCGASEIDPTFDEKLVDAAMFAFHQQMSEDNNFMLQKFASVVTALDVRAKPFLPAITANICVRIKTRAPKVRQQAADLISNLAVILGICNEERLLVTLSQLLYENLGEEYPEVLGSIISGIKAILGVVGVTKIVPAIRDLLPALTPILQNRHEKVQEQLVDLIGRIADRGSDQVNAKEWIRICFDLLDLLRAEKKSIRRAAVNTFGYIAKAIGPQDVALTLIQNLKVQERQMRICTTVALAIVAEACGPFTVIPALMNEYRVPSSNIQNGVLKSFSFMFEYIGEMAKDYAYAVAPVIEDALLDRDLVHRQTATNILKHMSLGVVGFGCENILLHLFNFVIANLFETSPHVINNVTEAFESLRVSVGPGHMLLYILQGLFHPAKRVREPYWRLYNLLYIGAQDALCPFFPQLPTYQGEDSYTIPETIYYNI